MSGQADETSSLRTDNKRKPNNDYGAEREESRGPLKKRQSLKKLSSSLSFGSTTGAPAMGAGPGDIALGGAIREDFDGQAAGGTANMPPPRIPAPQTMTTASLTQDMRNSSAAVNSTEDPARCRLDFVELWCYQGIAAPTIAKAKAAESERIKALENLGTDPADFGRVHNRIALAGLSLDVALVGESSEREEAQEEHWNMIGEQLILLKSKLLRQDANADVALLTPTQRKAHINATPDLDREQSRLFQSHYRKVQRLLRVQHFLSLFQKRLTASNTTISGEETKPLVREAIEEYEKHIHKLFATDAPATLPQELVGFLLQDLYQASANKQAKPVAPTDGTPANSNKSSSALAERLLMHVASIVQGNGPYSQSTCQSALRKLLQNWQDKVLEEPYLVQFGYGGGGTRSGEHSASSFRQEGDAQEDAMLRRLSNEGGPDAGILHIDVSDNDDDDEAQDGSLYTSIAS